MLINLLKNRCQHQNKAVNIMTALFYLLILNSYTARGDQALLTPNELVKVADIAITGKLTIQQNITFPNKQIVRVGVIHIDQVFKGLESSQPTVLIELAPYSVNGLLKSTDVVLKLGSEGLWLLKKHPNGLYRIERPGGLLPKEKARTFFK